MTYSATISSKGQILIPAPIRKRLALKNSSQSLIIKFDDFTDSIVISKPTDMEALSNRLTAQIKKKGIKPLLDAKDFYNNRPYGIK